MDMYEAPVLIKNVHILTGEEEIGNGYILLDKGKIQQVSPGTPETDGDGTGTIDGKGLYAVPGFIDGHIHGAAGADVMDATKEALDVMSSALPKEGTTAFLATTITQAPENIERALQNLADYKNGPGQAEAAGIHLEGPFINRERAGAQPPEYIMEPSIELFQKWQRLSGDRIKTVTMAPEMDQDGSFTRYLADSGVNVSAGHTSADFEGMKEAVSRGVRQVTHLCNAMTGIHHRDIGAVGAAFQLEELRAELITDGIHVSPQMLALIYQNMGSKRLIMITDAMRAKCMPAGRSELGGQTVIVDGDRAVLEDGTLAGSILKMHEGARRMQQINGSPIKDIIEMASVNPAKQAGLYGRKGSLTAGKDADILLIDDQWNIKYTICRGAVGYKGE